MSQEFLHAALRGTIAAMSMTGMRTFAGESGVLSQTPPQLVIGEGAPRMIAAVPAHRRHAVVELLHWGYGAGGGLAYRMLPAFVRRRAASGPLFGLALWAGFRLVIAPALGLRSERERSTGDTAALILDHLLYGLVLGEIRARPRT
ncbi:MAG: hypothetical protein GEU83_19340 [Pseudonocardiaceae bacterium]|nr:hypothetical protein [Pseudonocardiaceae bacterium]